MANQTVTEFPTQKSAEDREIEEGLAKAVNSALLKHKRSGNPIAVWEDGKVVWIPAERIDIPDEGDSTAA